MSDISASAETNREDLEEQRKDQELDICRQIFRNHFFPSKVRIISTRILRSRYLIVGKVNGTMKTFSFNFNREARFVEHEDAESDSEEDSEESDNEDSDKAPTMGDHDDGGFGNGDGDLECGSSLSLSGIRFDRLGPCFETLPSACNKKQNIVS